MAPVIRDTEMVLVPTELIGTLMKCFREKARGNREEWWVVRAGGRRMLSKEIPGAVLGRQKEKSSPL